MTADAGHGGLHAIVAASDIHGEIAAHRVAMHAETLRIDLRLLFEKSQPATAAEREEIPVVVLRMLALLSFIKGLLHPFSICTIDR